MASAPPLSLNELPSRDFHNLGLLSPPTPSGVPATKGTNALTSKITTVLSTSYSDTEFRVALGLLDDRGIANDGKTRRLIRLNLQREVIESNGEVIVEFGRVAEQLRRIDVTLGKLNAAYKEMKSHVAIAHNETTTALAEASSLFKDQQHIETKQELLRAFKSRFIMSENEIAALTLTAEPVDDRFFDSLVKAEKISKDCELLLGLEKQTLGTELMDQTSKNINFGFQKLYKWVQREFKTLNLENPQMNASIRRSLRVLAQRPSLFQNCLDFFAEARERILSDSFYLALTGTSASGVEEPSVKPIDMAAHDTLRYVGDMLAWIHSATVSEHEALEILFVAEGEELTKGLNSGRDAEIWRLAAEEEDEESDFNALKALNNLVDRDVSGAVRILRQRVEQVIQSNEDIIPAYKLANLINFYRVTFEKLLGSESNLLDCTGTLEIESLRQFRALVRDHIATLQGEFQQTPSDLGVPGFLQDCLKQLNAIAKTYDTSLSASEDRESEFENVIAEAFEPFMSGCDNMAKSIGLPDAAIFMINCRLAAANSLDAFDFTQRKAQKLRDDVTNEAKDLVESQYRFFCDMSGLQPFFRTFAPGHSDTDLKLNQTTLEQASQGLDDFLPSALLDAMERLKHLQDSGLAREITEEAAERFCQDFERLEEAVINLDKKKTEVGEPGSIRSFFPRTTGEIRVLLS